MKRIVIDVDEKTKKILKEYVFKTDKTQREVITKLIHDNLKIKDK